MPTSGWDGITTRRGGLPRLQRRSQQGAGLVWWQRGGSPRGLFYRRSANEPCTLLAGRYGPSLRRSERTTLYCRSEGHEAPAGFRRHYAASPDSNWQFDLDAHTAEVRCVVLVSWRSEPPPPTLPGCG